MDNQTGLSEVKNIIQSILKARKTSRLYPQNNPIYVNVMKELYDKISDFLGYADSLNLHFGKHDIFYDSESIYHNTERQENLALLFFKDGLRELTIKKGVTAEELGDFIRIISQDFDRDTVEDDLVTLLWGKNFENIRYIVEDTFLTEGEELEAKAVREARQKENSGKESLQKIYEDSAGDSDGIRDLTIFSLTDNDFKLFFDELERDASDKTRKLFNILFENFSAIEHREEYHDKVNHFMQAIEFSIRRGNLNIVTEVQSRIEQILESDDIEEEAKGHLSKIILFTGGEYIILLIGEILDGGREIEEQTFRSFFSHLRENAIKPLVKILAEMKNINSRRMVIDALVHIGRKDISPLLEEMNDPRWYVVRNIVHVLRKIGDKKSGKSLLKLLSHKDIRVKKEAVRALGEIGGESVVADLRKYLNDDNAQLRKAVLSALGSIRSDAAKEVIMDYITGKRFKDKDFNEKKECFHILALWHDDDVYDFLVRMVKKRSFLSSKKAESRACAAYSLGLLNNRDALPVLNKFTTSGNKLLREYSVKALRRLENGS
jgi:hypothetical protein